MQGTRYGAVAFAFALLAQVDQRDVGLTQQRLGHFRAVGPTPFRNLFLREALLLVGGDRNIHHLWVQQIKAVHDHHVFVDRLHLQPRIMSALLCN
jgi:hypothetical protein